MRLMTIAVLGLLVGGPVAAQQPKPPAPKPAAPRSDPPKTAARELADAYDELRSIRDSPATDKARLLAATRKGCNEMTRLLKDPAFASQLTKAFTAGGGHGGADVRTSLQRFLAEFLPFEQHEFEQNGVPSATAARLLATISAFREVKEVNDAKAVLDLFSSVRDQLCGAAAEIEKGPVDKGRVLTWTVRLGGAVTIVVDSLAATPSAGLPLASISIGTAMMGWGF